jgi:hypothetical protein
MDPEAHREDVVRRLLARGLSPAALRAMLPGWDELITRVVEATERNLDAQPDRPSEPRDDPEASDTPGEPTSPDGPA